MSKVNRQCEIMHVVAILGLSLRILVLLGMNMLEGEEP